MRKIVQKSVGKRARAASWAGVFVTEWLGLFMAVLAVVAPLAVAAPALAEPVEVYIAYQNDFHGHLEPFPFEERQRGGLAHLSGLVRGLRALYPGRVLWLDGGDHWHGTPFVNIFEGQPVVEAFTVAGLDAMVLGNHDFNYGQEALAARIEQAGYAVLSANTYAPAKGRWVTARHALFDVGGLKVAVFGLSTPDTPLVTHPGNVVGLEFRDPIATAAEIVPLLRQDADLVVAVTHLGFEEEQRLAAEVPGIDLIVGGHSHTLLERPVVVGDTLLVQAHEWGKFLGVLKLVVDDGQIVAYDGRLIPVSEEAPVDLRVAAVIDSWNARASEQFESVIGYAPVFLDGERSHIRTRPTNLGALVADAMRSAIGAEIALVNSGAIRASIQPGPISLRDIYNVLPFENTLIGVELTGEQLLAVLEHGVSFYPLEAGAFLQVAGVDVTFDPARPPGERITRIEAGGRPLDLERVYTVATSEFLVAGGDGYAMLSGVPIYFGAADGITLRDIFTAHLLQDGAAFPEGSGATSFAAPEESSR